MRRPTYPRGRIGIGQVLHELECWAGPLPAEVAELADVGGRGVAVSLFEQACAALAAGDMGAAAGLRWLAIATLRRDSWSRAIYRCGPVGGPYSFHRLGEAWPAAECC
jgi:hypothetical protein